MSKRYQNQIRRCNVINCSQMSTGHVEGKDLCAEHADYFKEQKNKWMIISLKGNTQKFKKEKKNKEEEKKDGIQESI